MFDAVGIVGGQDDPDFGLTLLDSVVDLLIAIGDVMNIIVFGGGERVEKFPTFLREGLVVDYRRQVFYVGVDGEAENEKLNKGHDCHN